MTDVVAACQAWGDEEMRRFPDGPRYVFKAYLPPPLVQVKRLCLKPKGVGGTAHSMSFKFTKNDDRADPMRVGRDGVSLTAVDFRNCVLTGKAAPTNANDWLQIGKIEEGGEPDHHLDDNLLNDMAVETKDVGGRLLGCSLLG